ncbi:MAG: NfeD family protein [Planctomycetaceae bacterium]|jgi:membrane protein implicated in regulation of membrane protease activity|nr:NfeD family protein [Planctomycetaceae bacterium]
MDFLSNPLFAVYLLCAVFGGTMMILQLLVMLAGLGGADDMDTGTDADGISGHGDAFDFFKVLSLKTVVAGFTFFGLGGLAGLTGGSPNSVSVLIAFIAGIAAVYFVYYLYDSIAKLKSDGSISDKTLVGAAGNVYLRIPAAGQGRGKVLVNQQERTIEYEAVSTDGELKTGAAITVVRIVSPTTVEVKPVE